LVSSGTAGTKTALDIIQLWFNYFASSFFNALAIYVSREAKERNAPVVGAFSPVSLFVYGDDHPSLPIFGALPEHQANWVDLTHTCQPKNSSIQGHLRKFCIQQQFRLKLH